MEGKDGVMLGIVDRRRRGEGLPGRTSVRVWHRGDLINERTQVPVIEFGGAEQEMRKCIMSAGRKRRDESARRSESVRKEIGPKNNQRPQKKKQCTEAAVQEV